MSSKTTTIDWTDKTWNPVTGCTKVSAGCKNCYAERLAHRLQAMQNPRYTNGFQVTLHEDLLHSPYGWRKPAMVFVNSMSDLFHPDVPVDFIRRAFDTMTDTHHTYQILTKRPERAARLASLLPWSSNIWMGTSVENARVMHRVDTLRAIPAHIRFLSCEPLIGSLRGIDLTGIHWVIAGGESGHGARPMDMDWARELRDACTDHRVPYFFKQIGGARHKRNGDEAILDGRLWREYPNQIAPKARVQHQEQFLLSL